MEYVIIWLAEFMNDCTPRFFSLMTDQKMDEEQSNHRTDEQLKDGILLGKQPRRMPIFFRCG